MTTLWDTTGTQVVKALTAERRTGGAMTSGCALTLIAVVGERNVAEAEAAATTAASHHPCRLLIVVRRQVDAPIPRLDAEVLMGGRLGPGEAVVMRMYGRLALHAESVTLPLLAPDVPVVTWWHAPPPDRLATDPLGVPADRRITDVSLATDPGKALAQRAEDYAPGDTDLAWTRVTAWRSQLASAVDSAMDPIESVEVFGDTSAPSAALLAGWLSSRTGKPSKLSKPTKSHRQAQSGIAAVHLGFAGGGTITLTAERDGKAVLERQAGGSDQHSGRSTITMPDRDLGDLLAEELHRLDADQPYAEALGSATGNSDLGGRPRTRTHIWSDPAPQPTHA